LEEVHRALVFLVEASKAQLPLRKKMLALMQMIGSRLVKEFYTFPLLAPSCTFPKINSKLFLIAPLLL
jgi:hypothetical protein